jgi:hypothetical protein
VIRVFGGLLLFAAIVTLAVRITL